MEIIDRNNVNTTKYVKEFVFNMRNRLYGNQINLCASFRLWFRKEVDNREVK